MERLFVYGSLKSNEIQKELLGRELIGLTDSLSNYHFSNIDIEGDQYLIAEPKDGELIDGIVYEVSTQELEGIDRYEGREYKRVKVRLDSNLEAWIYVRQF